MRSTEIEFNNRMLTVEYHFTPETMDEEWGYDGATQGTGASVEISGVLHTYKGMTKNIIHFMDLAEMEEIILQEELGC